MTAVASLSLKGRLPALAVGALVLVAVGGAAPPGGATAKHPRSHCAAAEEVVFSCAQGRKVISLCASSTGAQGARTQLRYAYGALRKVELEVSQAMRPDAFESGVTALSGGGIDYVRVRNGDFAYVLYTGLSKGWSQDGWVVEANGTPISHRICKAGATGPKAWGPVYAARLPRSPDEATFLPPQWVGLAPPLSGD